MMDLPLSELTSQPGRIGISYKEVPFECPLQCCSRTHHSYTHSGV